MDALDRTQIERALALLGEHLQDENLAKRISEKEMSPLLHSSRLRQLMKVLRPRVEASGFGEYLSDAASFPGEQYKDVFVEDIRRLFNELNTPL